MTRQAFAQHNTRHRLLQGFLRRLAALPQADAFALRGGMLVHHLLPRVGRIVSDLDLVCSAPYEIATIRSCLREILSRETNDEVRFDSERLRLDLVWPSSPHPGMRLFAAGRVGRHVGEIAVDLTFQLEVWPVARKEVLGIGANRAQVWACSPEMVVGTKLRVIGELGRNHWRPKDLADILLLLRRGDAKGTRAALAEAIERCFTQGLSPGDLDAQCLLKESSWWRDYRAARRWGAFVSSNPALGLPVALEANVQELRERLAPVWSCR